MRACQNHSKDLPDEMFNQTVIKFFDLFSRGDSFFLSQLTQDKASEIVLEEKSQIENLCIVSKIDLKLATTTK